MQRKEILGWKCGNNGGKVGREQKCCDNKGFYEINRELKKSRLKALE